MQIIGTVALLVAALCVTACLRYTAGDPEIDKDTLRPISAIEYELKVAADTLTPGDSQHYEKRRLAMLDRMMRQSGFCPSGYVVVSRTPVVKMKGALFGKMEDIYYRVRCK